MNDHDQLWASYTEARRTGSARRIAAAEDDVFRHYRPWALSLADAACPPAAGDPSRAQYRDAAETGLAQAIVTWGHSGEGRFGDVARRSILGRIRRLPPGISHRRLYGTGTREPPPVSQQRDAGATVRGQHAASGGVEVALLDLQGTIVWVNDAWRAFGEANGAIAGRAGVGASYLAVCEAAAPDPRSGKISRAIRRAAQGHSAGPVTVRIPCDAPGRARWYDVLIDARRSENQDVIGVAVALSTVSPTIWEQAVSDQRARQPFPVDPG